MTKIELACDRLMMWAHRRKFLNWIVLVFCVLIVWVAGFTIDITSDSGKVRKHFELKPLLSHFK